MSRQSKQAKNLKRAKEFTAARKAGNPGPARTEPKHGKVAARRAPQNKRRGPPQQIQA
jgi:hypothetical protein